MGVAAFPGIRFDAFHSAPVVLHFWPLNCRAAVASALVLFPCFSAEVAAAVVALAFAFPAQVDVAPPVVGFEFLQVQLVEEDGLTECQC